MRNMVARFNLLSAGFSAARMGIGATSVVYMLSLGLDLGDIAIIKIVQALVIFFAEIPTGLLADSLGRRASLLAACVSSILSFIFFVTCNSVVGFSIAEVFNGLCIAFWSGAFEALVIEKTHATSQSGNFIESLFARMGSYNALATMIGGLLGGILGETNLLWPFYLAAVLMFGVLSYCLMAIPSDKVARGQRAVKGVAERFSGALATMKRHQSNAIRFCFSSTAIRDFFVIQILIQFSIQPVLHYWQPYFQSLSAEVTTRVLGYVFFAYVGGQFVTSSIVSKLLRREILSPEWLNTVTAVVSFVGFAALWWAPSLELAIVWFVLLQSALNVLRNNLGASFNRFVGSEDRATVLSSVSFVSRLGMLVNLALLKLTAGLYPVSWVFLTSLVAMVVLLPLVGIWNRYSEQVRLA